MFCRTFQAGFRLTMPLLPYTNPKVLDYVAEVPALLKELGAKSVLFVEV